MTERAVLAPEAEAELRKIVTRIHDQHPEAARRLRQLVDVAARRIGARPLLGRVDPRLAAPRFRFWSLSAFSLLIVYNGTTDPVRIVRIVHTAQDLPKALKELRF